MKKSTRALMALVFAGAMVSVAACGDDDDSSSSGDSGTPKGDAAVDSGVPMDSSTPTGDSGPRPDTGTVADTGTAMDATAPAAACPTHPNVTEQAMLCVLKGPAGGEINTDLTIGPVQGKQGWLLQDAVFVGQDVGPDATPAAGKATATLTILPGTKLFGANASSFLAANRGSKLVAEGTADNAIVFTSAQVTPAPGDWGGVLLLGRAPTNQGNDVTGEVGGVKYGGPDAHDNSGSLKYVRIEFAGSRIDPTHEFNSLTFYGAGDGTTIDYVHAHAGGDDCFEFFGGAVNAKHIVCSGGGDDNFDWTDGWTGKVQWALAWQWPNFGDNGFEADNRDMMNNAEPYSNPTFANVTLIGNETSNSSTGASATNGMLLRRGTKGKFYSFVILNWKNACLRVDGDVSAGFVGTDLTISNSRISCTTNYTDTDTTAGKTQQFFEMGTANMTLANKDVLTSAYTYTQEGFNPLPKSDSGLLTGGAAPADAFFTPTDYIGAFGANNWLTGNWFKVTAYTPPAS